MQRVVISGTGLYTPSEAIDNDELVLAFNAFVHDFNQRHAVEIGDGTVAALAESSAEFITKASGIRSRHVVTRAGLLDSERLVPRIAARADNDLSLQAEMAVAAGRDALAQAGVMAADIDTVIVATSAIQRAYPAVAIEVQAALRCGGHAYDMNVACSSATFALRNACDAIRAGSARRVLLLNPEIPSAYLAWQDRDCHFIFGDVATAMVVEAAETATAACQFEVIDSRLTTIYSNAIRNNFGFINRCEDTPWTARDKLFRQEGRKVFKEVCVKVADIITDQLTDAGLTEAGGASVNRLWLHQANINMNDYVSRRVLGADHPRSQAPVVLDMFGNTASAGSIIAFHQHRDDLAVGDTGVICSFGAGYSIGSVLVRRCNPA